MAGGDRRRDDPVTGVTALEVVAVLAARFSRLERTSEDRLPFVGPFVPDRALRELALVGGEQVWEVEGDNRPGPTLLVSTRTDPKGPDDPLVSLGGEAKAAMTGGHVRDDALGIDRRKL